MRIAVVYDSLTGNTKLLADELKKALPPKDLVYCGPLPDSIAADLYLVGSWTDKGSCSEKIAGFLEKLSGKTIAVFATAGFGGSEEYYQAIFERIKTHIDQSNQILPPFFCQGKMPAGVLARYQKLAEANPADEKIRQSIANFHQAASHPDEGDLANIRAWLENILSE